MELAQAYADVIVMRWQAKTGRQAVIESGAAWDEVAASRASS